MEGRTGAAGFSSAAEENSPCRRRRSQPVKHGCWVARLLCSPAGGLACSSENSADKWLCRCCYTSLDLVGGRFRHVWGIRFVSGGGWKVSGWGGASGGKHFGVYIFLRGGVLR